MSIPPLRTSSPPSTLPAPISRPEYSVSPDHPEGKPARHADPGVRADIRLSLPLTTVDAYAENILLPKISQLPGVSVLSVSAGSKNRRSAFRSTHRRSPIAASVSKMSEMFWSQANVDLPKGTLNSPHQTFTLNTNDQLLKPQAYEDLIVAYRNGSPVRIRDIGSAIEAPENNLVAGWYNNQRAIILAVQRELNANVIETVDRIEVTAAAIAGVAASSHQD